MESGISVSKKGAHRKKFLTANENRAAGSFGRHPQNYLIELTLGTNY
jgi:hypothetical protein